MTDKSTLHERRRIHDIARRVFARQKIVQEWMQTPAMALDGRKPAHVIMTTEGAEQAETLLQRIEHGVYI